MFGLLPKPVHASKWAAFSAVFLASFAKRRPFSQQLRQAIFDVTTPMLTASELPCLHVAIERGCSVLP